MDHIYMSVFVHFIADFFSKLVIEFMVNKKHVPMVVNFYVLMPPKQPQKLIKKAKQRLVNVNRKLIKVS